MANARAGMLGAVDEGEERERGVLVFGSGRTVAASVERGVDTLRVHGPAGRVELTVRLLDSGPVLSFEAADLELKSPGAVRFDCAELAVRAREGIRLDTDGDLEARVGGDESVAVEGLSRRRARELELSTTEGEVRVDSASDAWINASMVLLNCDRAEEMAERARQTEREREREADLIRALDEAEARGEGGG